MKIISLLLGCLVYGICSGQCNKNDFLRDNCQDLRQGVSIEVNAAKVIGFGALHGSAVTEDVEICLLEDLVKNQDLKYYFPETDYSTARYFQKYIQHGDEELLKDLVEYYGIRVPQEKSVEVYEKWKKIRWLFKANQVQVIGTDKIVSYKYASLDLIQLVKEESDCQYVDSLKVLIGDESTNWAAYGDSEVRDVFERMIKDYESYPNKYLQSISDCESFKHIISNIKLTFIKSSREETIYRNYKKLNKRYRFGQDLQFFRLGVFHIMKSRINDFPSFFTRLTEHQDYSPNEIISIQGFLSSSKVLWDVIYNKSGEYAGYTTKRGFGTSDYWLEHYKGIGRLKSHKIADVTIFNLKGENSPFNHAGVLDFVKIKKLPHNNYWIPDEKKSTLDYIDFAILITHSSASRPLEILNNENE
ncbi:hypothetical protein EYV94_20270 [Puteibacter caeruleilacunae]|nr:hypothetical protein EYV94_20270 [Puteibacter caeruleilacunae]